MNISLEYYKVFYYVIKFGSLSAAAEKLCISQPAVSQAVHNLEREFGCQLFIRNRKGMQLTTEGRVLSHFIVDGYEKMLQGEENLLKMINLDAGEIRIGASDMTLQYFLLPYLEKFHEKYPQIKVNVTNGPTPETIRYLKEGKIDFGVVTTPFPDDPLIHVENVRKIRDIFIGGRDFQFLRGKKIEFKELTNLPLICLEKNTSTRRYLDQVLAEKEVAIEPEFELATSDIIVQFVRRNLGIGHVVFDFAQPYLDTGELFEIEFKEQIPLRNMSIITAKQRPMSVAGGKMLETIKENH